jgi:hypothetical protein
LSQRGSAMASIRKRGSKWQVQIRRNGLPAINRTFIAKDDAIRWAREQDRAVDRGETFPSTIGDTRQTFLSEIMDRYVQEVSPPVSVGRWIATKCALWCRPWVNYLYSTSSQPI